MKTKVRKFQPDEYDASKLDDAQLVDDWKLTVTKYSTTKAGKKTEFDSAEEVEGFATKLLAEILKRDRITFHPENMAPDGLELVRNGLDELIQGGLYLKPPFGKLIFEGRSSAIAKSREFERLQDFNILVSDGEAYGFIRFRKPKGVTLKQFKEHATKHGISEGQRAKWWPTKTALYISEVRDFIKFEEPKSVLVKTGAQVFMDNVEFKDVISKPYPQEHACRLRNPDDFKKGSFRRMERGHNRKRYSIILGRLKGETTLTEQAYRYDKEKWTASEGKAHCTEHDGTFEAAIEEEKTTKLTKDNIAEALIEKEWDVAIWKSEEQRFVYGVVLQPDIEDAQGDVINKEEIAKTAHQFMENCQKIGVQHNEIVPQIKIWESYLAPQDMTIAGQEVVKGSWILGVHILEDEIWQSVKKGDLTAFSIKGWADTRGD